MARDGQQWPFITADISLTFMYATQIRLSHLIHLHTTHPSIYPYACKARDTGNAGGKQREVPHTE